MKITISHCQAGIDPSGTYTDEEFPAVRAALESAYQTALLAVYPDAEIEFRNEDSTHSIRVTGTGLDDPSEIEENVQSLCEGIFETGNFWI